jgi:hypothetical protein
MRSLALAASAAVVMLAAPLIATTPAAAQVGVEVGPRAGVYVGSRHRPNCKTITVTEWRHGAKVTRTERRCRDRD